jgi:DNA-binding NarL/FixJ family response regulator
MADLEIGQKPSFAKTRHRVFLLQNHPLMVLGTRAFLDKQGDFEVCGAALTPAELLRNLPDPSPDLVVFELSICGPFDFAYLKKVRQQMPRVPLLCYSYHEEVIFATRAIEAGASGYLMKEAEPDKLACALRQVARGEIFLSDRTRERLALREMQGCSANGSMVQSFSNRELQIFQCLGEGLSDDVISIQTGLTLRSISSAQYRMRKKLGLQNRAELVQCAMHWAYYEGDFS